MTDTKAIFFYGTWLRESCERDHDFGYVMRVEAGDLVVTPDPFDGARVPLEIAARELPDRPFASKAEG